jgi:hypothetical protein
MSTAGRYIDEKIENSITSGVSIDQSIDGFEPLSFTDWLQYNKFLFTNTQDFLIRYQSYLNNWFKQKNVSQEDSSETVKTYYLNLINEIVLNYTTIDERRYLQNLNLQDPRDLSLAIPFFAKKIKDICIYFSTLRDTVQTAPVQYNLKGSNLGTNTVLYNSIINSLFTDDLTSNILTLQLSLSTIRNNLIIETEDIFDTYTDYYDINPVASSEDYNSKSDTRATYFKLNQYDIDPDLFLQTGFSILRAIVSYPFYLTELGQNLYINPPVSVTDLQFLKDSDYTDLIPISSVQALNLSLKAQEIQKYMGVDFYYVQTDSTGSFAASGLLFEAESEFANVVNKRFPTVVAIPSEEFLKTGKEIGLFFKPDKLGLLNFTNFKFTPALNLNSLEPDTVYYFPDPYKYGNVSSNTGLTFKTPLTFIEQNYFNKTDVANSFKFGDAATDPYYHTFRAYQSREQTLNYANFGLSRYVDSQEFFTGDDKTVWANKDVYGLGVGFAFPIDQRLEKLLSINKTLVQYKTDVYGNEYGLYKLIEKYTGKLLRGLVAGDDDDEDQTVLTETTEPIQICLMLDGHVFNDAVSGVYFDYTTIDPLKNYSGVVLKTVTSLPPTFPLSQVPFDLFSYVYSPESFCSDVSQNTFVCKEADGFTITNANGTPLADYPSDNPDYSFFDSAVYYETLADGGFNQVSPTYRATFAYPGYFTFTPPLTSTTTYDGFRFLNNGEDPCADYIDQPPLYTEEANFADIRLPERGTVVNETLSTFIARQTIYNTRNTLYGDLYFRNSNSSIITPLSTALSGVLIKYTPVVRDEIHNNIINFDLYYDTLQIETENYLIFDRIVFDYDINTVTGLNPGINVVTKGKIKEFEKFSSVWFDETSKELLFCKTTLYNEYSATNYKAIFPKIYSFNLDTQTLTQKYPQVRDEALTFNMLRNFSLSGKNIELNIISIDKPLLTYNDENNLYKLTYIGRDLTEVFYIVTSLFRYIDGKLTIVNNSIYKLGSDVYDQNFANPETGSVLETYTILGSAIGHISDNTLTWGNICNAIA